MKSLNNKFIIEVFKYIFLILVYIDIFQLYNSHRLIMVFLWIFSLLLMINDHIRNSILEQYTFLYNLSLSITIIGAGILKYNVNGPGTNAYFIFSLIDIFILSKKISISLFILHAATYCALLVTQINLNNTFDIGVNLLGYFLTVIIFFLFRNSRLEKEEIKNLNKELEQYAMKVEELTIIGERAKVSQELHDSLGHSLMALSMNLEYAENIFDSNPEKAKDIIRKSRRISKDCITDLRRAVDTIKAKNSIDDLRYSLNSLFKNFEELGKVTFNFEMNDSIELVNPDIKNCIYKTIQEAVTNAIKHGKATVISIKLFEQKTQICILITNNGALPQKDILKSTGLKGMEDRISALGGRLIINYSDEFIIKAFIPKLLNEGD